MTSRTLNKQVNASVHFKCENFQRGGAFKFRGAYNALALLSPEEREKGVIAHSSGNHAQAVSFAASLLGIQAVIVMHQIPLRSKFRQQKGTVQKLSFVEIVSKAGRRQPRI